MEEEIVRFEPMTFVDEVSQTEWATADLIDKLKVVQTNEVFKDLSNVLPDRWNIFRVLKTLRPADVKVVILGQDPYPRRGDGCGLCFSFEGSVRALPASLINIYQELSDEGFEPPRNGDLSHWQEQGVLLLNTSLTVRVGTPNSHTNIWKGFAGLILKQIPKGYVALLWGNDAKSYTSLIQAGGGTCLNAVHPSPMSAHKGFFGCNHFVQCNDLLKKMGKEPVQW